MNKIIGSIEDYIKGNRIGSREAELENSSGWHAVRKVHRSKRNYNRKNKHKKSGHNPDFFLLARRIDLIHQGKVFSQVRKNIIAEKLLTQARARKPVTTLLKNFNQPRL